MKQAQWSSKWVFILAAIGAAAGLGNLWKFPYLTYENGGAAFLFAYIICLFAIAKPIMMTEVALGQKLKKDVVGAFDHMAGGVGRFFGWLIIMALIGIAGYYAAVIAWGWDFLVASPTVAWGDDANGYFFQNILQITDGPSDFGGLSWPIVFGILATYIAVYLSIFKGVISVGTVVKWTVPLPFIFLFILFLNAITLEGALDGFKYFLVPDWTRLTDLGLWKDAITMSFFSTSVGFAISILYGRFNKDGNDIVSSTWYITLGDFLVSLTAGLAMFGTLGYMAMKQGIGIEEVVGSGPVLAFVTIPTAIASLPILPGLFAVLFFGAILTLAIDSMFAIVETILASFREQFKKIKALPASISVGIMCVIFFFWSLAFAGGNGLYRLDILDHFILAHLFYITTTAQLIFVGWFLPVDELRTYVNKRSKIQLGTWFNGIIKFIAPLILIGLYVSSLPGELEANYEGYETSAIIQWGIIPMVVMIIASALLASRSIKK